jgi:predicted metal-dependent hydrolase
LRTLVHLKERQHDIAFYSLCNYMESIFYHRLEIEVRVYLTHLEVSGARLWGVAGVEAV